MSKEPSMQKSHEENEKQAISDKLDGSLPFAPEASPFIVSRLVRTMGAG